MNSRDADDPAAVNGDVVVEVFGDSLADPLTVGDLLLVEATLYVETVLHNDEDGHEAWSEFGDTLAATIEPLTAGAVLTAVPLPASGLLLMMVLPLAALVRRA